jgi:hypothetical protein
MSSPDRVWVFNGVQSNFPSGVFLTREVAEFWVRKYALTGTLTAYPLDVGMYDYAIERGLFVAKTESQASSIFIGKFTGGGIDHFHYEDGAPCGAQSGAR